MSEHEGGAGSGPEAPPASSEPPRSWAGLPRWAWVLAGGIVVAATVVLVVIVLGGDDDVTGVVGFDDVETATVRIEAEGSFVHPEVGAAEAFGFGSGFVIDPEGIVVTNNHVVTGATSLRVRLDGAAEPRTARVLGISECSDLAVIDISGQDYPFLEWSRTPPNAGLDVFAFAFPPEADEPTRTRGIVSNADAEGDTVWTSVDNTFEHTAAAGAGASGGPLVLSDGTVLGVDIAPVPGSERSLAISHVEARPLVDTLASGEDVTSIGVNGQAVRDEETGLSGVWVAGVDRGSPADELGLVGGDVITRMEEVPLAADGTMSQYCDILRSHPPGDVLSVEVLRSDTDEVLEGEINGEPLEPSFSFAQELRGEFGAPSADRIYSEFTTITDDLRLFAVDVPVDWSDVDGRPLATEDGEAPSLRAAPDLARFANSFGVPGVETVLFRGATDDEIEAVLDGPAATLSEACASVSRSRYEETFSSGVFDRYAGCGEEDATVIVLAAGRTGADFLVRVRLQVVSAADLAALDTVLDTFEVLEP